MKFFNVGPGNKTTNLQAKLKLKESKQSAKHQTHWSVHSWRQMLRKVFVVFVSPRARRTRGRAGRYYHLNSKFNSNFKVFKSVPISMQHSDANKELKV